MRIKNKLFITARQVASYLKDYRFSSILIRYFLLLLVCLVLPMSALSVWYGNRMKKNLIDDLEANGLLQPLPTPLMEDETEQ